MTLGNILIRKTLEEEESNDEDDILEKDDTLVKDGKDEKEKKDKENEEDSSQILSTVLEKSKSGTEPNLKVVLSMPVHLVERILEYQVRSLFFFYFINYISSIFQLKGTVSVISRPFMPR